MTLGSRERRVTGSNFSIQGAKSTCNPMFESVKDWFRPKQTFFNFLPLTCSRAMAFLSIMAIRIINMDNLMLIIYVSIKLTRKKGILFFLLFSR